MTDSRRSYLLVAVLAAGISLAVTLVAFSALRGTLVRDYLASHPEDVQRIVKDYFVKNPAVMKEVLEAVLGSQPGGPSNEPILDKTAAIASNAQLLFASPRQVTLGNPEGDVSIVEFFDYNCGYCRRAMADMLTLIKDDPKLRVVLKEFPILSPGSVEAARVAVAVRMQDPTGQKYLDFHQKMFESPGQADKGKALAAAKQAGLDMGRLEKDLASEEVNESLAESAKLAQALGIDATPCYVVGNNVVLGALGAEVLKDKIQGVRSAAK